MAKYINTLSQGSILHGKSYNYCIEKVLGQGSFGITYLASVKMQGALGSIDAKVKVAIKEFFMKEINGREGTTVTSGSKGGLFADYRKKFVREAKNLSKLQHPNIIKVLECFEANNTVYYTMEYLDGGSLDELISKKHGLSEAETVKYTMQIGNALSYMHEHKVLHLDLKPGNIMLSNGNAVLIDFGLSKQYDAGGNPESSTTVGGGTPGYAPLEQANYHDGKDFPITMDVYALGATMYKMFVGERAPIASEILNDGFPTQIISAKCSSKEMVACVEKAMAPLKKERYQSVNELLKAVSLCTENKFNQRAAEETIVCEVPILKDGGDWGFTDDYENGQVVRRRVTNHIPLPDTIKITKEESRTGNNYAILLHHDNNKRGYVSVVDVMGERKQVEILGGFPDDVIRFLKDKGFFSPIHWERFESTQEWTRDPVEVRFEYKGGGCFTRFSDAPDEGALHRAVDGLLFNTTLDKYISALTMKEDFEPDDILRREETIYGGPPIEEQDEIEEEKTTKKETGCFSSLFFLMAFIFQVLYPGVWCLTFLTEKLSYPNLWSIGIVWIVGSILALMINDKGKDKDVLINLGLWLLLIIETAIVYAVNYI